MMDDAAFDIEVGELKAARAPAKLRTQAIGSCVAVALYDSMNKVGGIAHVMLPATDVPEPDAGSTKYADVAIPALITAMLEAGALRESIRARLIGGAMIVPEAFDIGAEVERSVEAILGAEGITIDARRIGGDADRSCMLDTATGVLQYREKGGEPKVL